MRHARNRSDFKSGISPELAIEGNFEVPIRVPDDRTGPHSSTFNMHALTLLHELPDVLSVSLQTQSSHVLASSEVLRAGRSNPMGPFVVNFRVSFLILTFSNVPQYDHFVHGKIPVELDLRHRIRR